MLVEEDESSLLLPNAHELMGSFENILWLLMRGRRHYKKEKLAYSCMGRKNLEKGISSSVDVSGTNHARKNLGATYCWASSSAGAMIVASKI